MISYNQKENKMLKKILVVSMLLVSFSVSDTFSEPNYKEENRVLRLKLEIFELRERNKQLQKIIDDFSSKDDNTQRHADAVLKLKRELHLSRTRGI